MYARNFGTGSRWLPGVILEISGPVSYLIKLTNGHLVRRRQDYIRCRLTSADGEQSTETPR